MRYLLPLADASLDLLAAVGGKTASLGEMIRELTAAGVRVPDGFALTTDAYRRHLAAHGIAEEVVAALDGLDLEDTAELARVAARVREAIASRPLPPEVAEELERAYAKLCERRGERDAAVAVRSSATAEDLPTASFAGQLESYLGVRGFVALERAARDCMASLFTDRAIVYRANHGIDHRGVALSVCVQEMVGSGDAASGVAFTLDTESGHRGVVLVDATWGLGELLVQGRVDPDRFWVHKAALEGGARALVRKELGAKAERLVAAPDSPERTRLEEVPDELRARFALTDDEVLELARAALAIERHYGERLGRPTPMDLEWAKDGPDGALFVVQARPETVHGAVERPTLELFHLDAPGAPLVRGTSVGARVASGPVRVVRGIDALGAVGEGEVIVAETTDPAWEPVLRRAAAVVTDRGGRTCHAAIVAREHGIPCVVGTGEATRRLADGQMVTVSCAEGDEGRVYDGEVPFEREEIDPAALPTPPVPLQLNLADPDSALRKALLPAAGVGLMRIEFLVSNWIGVHPMALVDGNLERSPDRAAIEARVGRHASPADFFVERLAHGMGHVAAAFHPRPVLVRFSDFKTNEYAGLLGGAPFEPTEANPMIGFRGASRYYDERYRAGFALECAAVRRVRDEMGLTNLAVMIPFCRTLGEGRRVLAEMEANGLVRGTNGLEVWVMCEIPNNVVLAEEFCELFDGFSIGTNDLTQLTLGVDRDSELLRHLFDERDPGVRRSIASVVAAAHRKGRRVGLCGQAPSDHPDFAAFLVETGIDSISLTPDSLVPVIRRLGRTEE